MVLCCNELIYAMNSLLKEGKFIAYFTSDVKRGFTAIKTKSVHLMYCKTPKINYEIVTASITDKITSEDAEKTVEKALMKEFYTRLIEYIMGDDFKEIINGTYKG